MKKILGIDLGVASIGWALINSDEELNKNAILGMGVRIVPLTTDEKDEFTKGNKISKNQKRSVARSLRRGLDRYQQRRHKLRMILKREGMLPDAGLFELPPTALYGLRAKAATTKITPEELGRVLLHLNQRRGYKGTRQEENEDTGKKKDGEDKGYLAEINNRYKTIKENNQTVGQHFFEKLTQQTGYSLKNKVFPRIAFIEEFDAIMKAQQLPENLVREIRNETIYFQRPLKSKKNLVSVCGLAGHCHVDKSGKEKWIGPKVAPVSSPIAQVCRIWEHINNLRLSTTDNRPVTPNTAQKQKLFELFDTKETVKLKDIAKALGFKDAELISNKQLEKGIKGNSTRTAILKILEDKYPELMKFELKTIPNPQRRVYHVDPETAEVRFEGHELAIDARFEQEPFYQLWHVIYSIPDLEECSRALETRFGLDRETAEQLARLDFTKTGFSNKSVRAMRKILPYLMHGLVYSAACELAGYNHSNSVTKTENESRHLSDFVPLLPKNTLRQPVVEKILNQLIHVVNGILKEYGRPDEIRVELARELRQSQEERNKTFTALNKREKENDKIRADLQAYGLRATRNNVIKHRLYQEISGDQTRTNATCIYCGQLFGYADAMRGNGIDVEHIIPQQLRFDDSQSNKTLAHRHCNIEKGNSTAFDFMATKSKEEFDAYLQRVQDFYERKIISFTKRKNLLTAAKDLKDADFINRQLQETRYISRKSRELLSKVARDVHATTGSITEYLRRTWGWNDVLMNLQLPQYRHANLTKEEQREGPDGHIYTKEIIPEWSKRKDHRHHAIDALVVACTKQGFIQRLNTLHAKETRDSIYEQTKEYMFSPGKMLDRYFAKERPFTTREVEEAVANILISIKPGKKVATKTVFKSEAKMKGKNRETGVLTPRGPLSEESIYGKVKLLEPARELKYIFENPDLIVKDYIREKVKNRLAECNGDTKKALASLKKKPVYLDADETIKLEFASCYKDEYVIKYPLSSLKHKDVPAIIDPVVREKVNQRFLQFPGDEKKAIQSFAEEPIWFNEEKRIPVKTVRCKTGLSAVEPIRRNEQGEPIAFVKPGNNHHMAFYTDQDGNLQPHICSFWHAVERKKYGFPVIVDNPGAVWDQLVQNKHNPPDSFLSKLPNEQWTFSFSMQQNEMFLLGLSDEALQQLIADNDYAGMSPYLYRVQKMAIIKNSINLWFRHHLETEINDGKDAKEMEKFYNIQSIPRLKELNPYKLKLNHLGQFAIP
jgi:CRISPR-associated endonuclease Csn1